VPTIDEVRESGPVRRLKRVHGQHGRQEQVGIVRGRVRNPRREPRWAVALRGGIAAGAFVGVIAPSLTWAAGACDDKVGEVIQATGSYVPAGQSYAQAFVFAMRLDCHGKQEVVTVQRSTGNLPVCSSEQDVEVVGKLVWNRALVDGHYEINNPSKVVCVPVARAETKAAPGHEVPLPAPAAPPIKTEPRRAEARGITPSVWVGRYEDSRGAGDVTFTLVRGTSTVSGTWRLRTGGGGPLAGNLEGDGRRLEFRMDNMAPECPGTFQGVADLSDVKLVGTYHGQDCEGAVTDGRLELRLQ
jgi:hypothetical protein